MARLSIVKKYLFKKISRQLYLNVNTNFKNRDNFLPPTIDSAFIIYTERIIM